VDLYDRKLGDFGVLGFSILNLEVQRWLWLSWACAGFDRLILNLNLVTLWVPWLWLSWVDPPFASKGKALLNV
jgi:hypothetical protein